MLLLFSILGLMATALLLAMGHERGERMIWPAIGKGRSGRLGNGWTFPITIYFSSLYSPKEKKPKKPPPGEMGKAMGVCFSAKNSLGWGRQTSCGGKKKGGGPPPPPLTGGNSNRSSSCAFSPLGVSPPRGGPKAKRILQTKQPSIALSGLPALNCLHVTVKRPNCLIRFRSRKAYLALLVLFEWIKNCFGIFYGGKKKQNLFKFEMNGHFSKF